jgi:hypothetical protein
MPATVPFASTSPVVEGEVSLPNNESRRWTADTGMVGIDVVPGTIGSVAWAVSADRSAIVGGGIGGFPEGAMIWDEINGMLLFKDVLENDFGIDLTGWKLREAYGVSADGLFYVGVGENPMSDTEGWIANVRQCTVPASAAGGIVGDATRADAGWTGLPAPNTQNCVVTARLYCVGQRRVGSSGTGA